MPRPHRPVVLSLVLLLGACGGEAPSAPDASPDAPADALPPPPPDAAPLDASDAPPVWCPAPGAVCGGGCVDTSRDPAHCGGCERACLNGTACVSSRCIFPPLDAGRDAVEAVDAMTSDAVEGGDVAPDAAPACTSMTPGNCCGVGCPRDRWVAEATCIAGRCGIVCERWAGDCNGVVADGCEVDLTATSAHCGACGARCANGGACVRGVCPPVCPAGRGNCDGDNANGCETNTSLDAVNCGQCGNRCPGGRSCSAGMCR